ncbi:cytochrome P450 [Nocardia anaemiae]|uniref:cytochrome P450 n=1 Tax=Nocardia anaemiae TaxID=263910 RepID=UPI0007A544F9|nr:cytochrome P450 [Nocardia anaemiae]
MTLQIFDAEFAANPWPTLRRLRADGGVHRVRTPDGPPAWLVTRFADVRAGLLDDRLSTQPRYAGDTDYRGFAVPSPLDLGFLESEPADHARLRRAVTAELSPRRLAEWVRTAPELVSACLSDVETGVAIDLIERFAVALPATVLGELLGLAAPERAALLRWARSTLLRSATPPRARDTLTTMRAIVIATIEGARGDNVLGRLVRRSNETGSLSANELASMIFYLLFVWYEVLVDLIAGSALALLTHPDQLGVLRTMTDTRPAVDELLRYLSPQVVSGPRFATTDLDIAGHTIRSGDTVLLCLASANHDPDIFDNPAELDLARGNNPQLGLGYGGHACLGTALVRTIAGAVLRALLLDRTPTLACDPRNIQWRSGFRHRGPLDLAIVLSR